eukprot:2386331-Rhodomonas_salina.1
MGVEMPVKCLRDPCLSTCTWEMASTAHCWCPSSSLKTMAAFGDTSGGSKWARLVQNVREPPVFVSCGPGQAWAFVTHGIRAIRTW